MQSKKICVVGAGPSGLCAVKYLKENDFKVTCFEKQDGPGGVWRYREKDKDNSHIVHPELRATPVHRHMLVSHPTVFWRFQDFDYDTGRPEDTSSFVPHQRILEFFERYIAHYDLDSYIKYNVIVKKIKPMDTYSSNTRWIVTTKKVDEQVTVSEVFNAVIFANGREWFPNIPDDIPGLTQFRGKIMHSAEYDCPEQFKKTERVMIVGSKVSALDLVYCLHTHLPQLTLSHHSPAEEAPSMPPNVIQVSDVDHIDPHTKIVHFVPGEWNSPDSPMEIDTIIFATGFLAEDVLNIFHPSAKLELNGPKSAQTIEPLHRQLVHMDYHSLCFPYQQRYNQTMLMIERQIEYYVRWLMGKFPLPSREEMEKIRRGEIRKIESEVGELSCESVIRCHNFFPEYPNRQIDYLNELSKEAGLTPIPQVVQDNFNLYIDRMFNVPMDFKRMVFELDSDGKLTIHEPNNNDNAYTCTIV